MFKLYYSFTFINKNGKKEIKIETTSREFNSLSIALETASSLNTSQNEKYYFIKPKDI